jgi:TatD DNase family protein
MPESLPPLVDSHVHLQDPVYQVQLAEHLNQAAAQGIKFFICNGSSENDWERVSQLAAEYPAVIPCFGLHPWYVPSRSANWLQQLRQHLVSRSSAVGEIGLDRWIEPRDETAQEEVFRAQLQLARELDRPAMVHCLRAWGWLTVVLKNETPPRRGFMLHAYGGSPELIAPLLDLGAYFSFAGTTLRPDREKARAALKKVPLDRLLIETDAPDLAPPPPFCPYFVESTEGKSQNHPANLNAICRGISEILNLPVPQLREQLWENSKRLFGFLWPNLHASVGADLRL